LYIDVLVPGDGRHQRLLDLDEFADAIEAGQLDIGTAVDGLRRWQRFLDRHLHAARDPNSQWTDFPPRGARADPVQRLNPGVLISRTQLRQHGLRVRRAVLVSPLRHDGSVTPARCTP
jgi:hypothetical protein